MEHKVWCVSYYTGLGYSDASKLFLSEIDARKFADERITHGCIDVKCFRTRDIWSFTAKHFEEKLIELIGDRYNESMESCTHLFSSEEFDESLEEELVRVAKEVDLEDFSCDIWKTFDSPGLDVYALSCAWTYDGTLHHYTDTLEVC